MRIFKDFTDEQINQILNDQYNVIGIDFGDGESTAALCTQNEIKALYINGLLRDTKMVTAVFIPQANPAKYKIGLNAENDLNSFISGKFYINFKSKPSEADTYAEFVGERVKGDRLYTKKEIMQMFLQAFLNILFSIEANGLNDQKPTILLIGRPAGKNWEGEEEREYQKLLSENLAVNGRVIEKVIVLSESFAALAQTVGKNNVRYAFEDSILCVDSGSSTLDTTCVSGGENRLEYGVSLGAKFIENNMVNLAITQYNNKYNKSIGRNDLVEAGIVFKARQAKENFFGDVGMDPIKSGKIISEVKGHDEPLIFKVSDDNMALVVKQMGVEFNDKTQPTGKSRFNSWCEACVSFFLTAKHYMHTIPNLKKVILTGGGSKMPFVKDISINIFGESIVECSGEPSYTVAKGLAWIAQQEAKTEQIYRDIIHSLDSLILNSMTRDLEKKLSAVLSAKFLDDVIMPVLKEWKASQDTYPILQDASDKMDAICNQYLTENRYQREIAGVIISWLEQDRLKVIASINEKLEQLFGTRIPDNYQFQLPDRAYTSIVERIGKIRMKLNSKDFLNRVLGDLGLGQVLFTYKHSLKERDNLYANAERMYPNGLLYGFRVRLLFKDVQGLIDTIEEQIKITFKNNVIVTGTLQERVAAELRRLYSTDYSKTIYFDIITELHRTIEETISEQISVMAMYVYKQKD